MKARDRVLNLLDEAKKADIGYNQARRTTWFDRKTRKIIPNKAADCTSLSAGIWYLAGIGINPDTWSEAIVDDAIIAGAGVTDVSGWDLVSIQDRMRPGDIIRGKGHAVIVDRDKRVYSAEHDENGKASGGKDGQQVSNEIYTRDLYKRTAAGSRSGWSHLLIVPEIDVADDGIAVPFVATTTEYNSVLSLWSRGGLVLQLQKALKARYSYAKNLAADGILGPKTQEVVKIFQKNIGGVSIDGQWGPATNTRSQQTQGWSL
jgi:hypothetical protein